MKKCIYIVMAISVGLITGPEAWGLEDFNSDEALSSRYVESPSTFFGLAFNSSSSIIATTAKDMGLSLVKEKKAAGGVEITLQTYDGVPAGLWVEEGSSDFLFFSDSLVRMDLFCDPTYKNFLLLRKQLMHSLGERFVVEEKQESMDALLKAHLAALKENEYTSRTENAIITAIKRGSTFFFYSLEDTQGEMNVTLSFSAVKESELKLRPQLHLHYSSKEGLAVLKEAQDSMKKKILPE